MKTLFIGGIKSGKSLNAENYTLERSKTKPVYLATTEFIDAEMHERIEVHKNNRKDYFYTIEEPLKLFNAASKHEEAILIECISMWINNMMYHNLTYHDMVKEIDALFELDNDMVFVLNDVGSCVISDNRLVREFVDINGKIAMLIASRCDEVYHTIAGISTKIK